MEKYNCIFCGYISNVPFCHECLDKARGSFDKICEFIKSHPKPTIIDVYNNTGTPLVVIKGFLDMGWLELANEEIKVQKPRQ